MRALRGVELGLFHVAMQPTTLCNLDCRYCYLPLRDHNHKMAPEVASAVASELDSLGTPTRIVWHAGEPLTAGTAHLRELIAPFDRGMKQNRVAHNIQTNATLIDEAWCDLFRELDIQVGVSLDGPRDLSSSRKDWNGRPAFDRAMAGIDLLKAQRIPFALIIVVGQSGLDSAEELYDFACDIGCRFLGINLEETEGQHAAQDLPKAAVRRFWERLFIAWRARPEIQVREFVWMLRLMREVITPSELYDALFRHELFPSVSVEGDVVLLSPELVDNCPQFVVGNVLERPLSQILRHAHEVPYVKDFLRGVETCQRTCEYYRLCGGGAASNRFFENADLSIPETESCRNRTMALAEALISIHGEGDLLNEKPSRVQAS